MKIEHLFHLHLKLQQDDKPGSVVNDHLSRMIVTNHLKRPT